MTRNEELAVARGRGLRWRAAHAVGSDQLGGIRLGLASSGFHKSVEPQLAPVLPIWGGVIVDARPATENAEEQMPGWFDHDADVAAPYNQVPRFRFLDTFETFDASIEIG